MKNLIYSIIVIFSITNCTAPDCSNNVQDGNETGVDCGGDCSPCSSSNNNNTNTNNLPSDLLKTWTYNSRNLETVNSLGQVLSVSKSINTNPNCNLEFTNNLYYSTGGINYYYTNGMIGSCNSGQSQYFYNNNEISGTYGIDQLTSDSLVISTLSGNSRLVHQYSINSNSHGSQEIVDWSINLASYYLVSNEVSISVYVNNTLVDTIPILNNQQVYSGSETVNLATQNPSFSLYVNSINAFLDPNNTNSIEFKSRTSIGGVTQTETDMLLYCTGGGCNSGNDYLQNKNVCLIQWTNL